MNEQIDTEKIIDFSVVSIFGEITSAECGVRTHVSVARCGNLIADADHSTNPGKRTGRPVFCWNV